MAVSRRMGAIGILCCCAGIASAQQTIYVNGTTGDDGWSGLCEVWDGGTCGPKATIQAGIDAAADGDTVLVADGLYTGEGNRNIVIVNKSMTVASSGGPAVCAIDCAAAPDDVARAFYCGGSEATVVVRGFTIVNGYESSGGAIQCEGDVSTDIENCIIAGNWAASGGGLCVETCGSNAIRNCLIVGNVATQRGGGVCFLGCGVISGCTIAHNWYFGGNASGGGVCGNAENVAVVDCVVWGNYPNQMFFVPPPIGGKVSYSNVEGGWLGEGCVGVDPMFTDPLGPDLNPATWQDNDYHLLPGSPCIGRGDPQTFGVSEVDGDGEPRVMGGRVDMGWDEFTDRPFVFGDLNCDGVRDAFDIDPFVLALVDLDGYAATYPDCNVLNGDCNDDGSVDLFDVDAFVELMAND